MTVDGLPLLDIFTRLREAGMPLGIDDYQQLLHALHGGFGLPDRDALKRLCQTLWIKSAEEARLFDYHFDQVIPRLPKGEADSYLPKSSTTQSISDPAAPTFTSEIITSSPAEYPDLILKIEDEIQAAQVALEVTSSDEDIPYSRFILTDEYWPVTRRQMKQSWRYLRRPLREGPPSELDIEATVDKIGRQGILLEPVMVPHRINRAELALLIDRDGSMIPFHTLSRRLTETALRGGRLGKAGVYYFHNCPVKYLYHDPMHQKAKSTEDVLDSLHNQRTTVLIFSDAGAARGGFNPGRFELTRVFLNRLRLQIRYVAWLNPMPRSRWIGTTADTIARLVPMFELSRRGLDDAISVLRGRPMYTRRQIQ